MFTSGGRVQFLFLFVVSEVVGFVREERGFFIVDLVSVATVYDHLEL